MCITYTEKAINVILKTKMHSLRKEICHCRNKCNWSSLNLINSISLSQCLLVCPILPSIPLIYKTNDFDMTLRNGIDCLGRNKI